MDITESSRPNSVSVKLVVGQSNQRSLLLFVKETFSHYGTKLAGQVFERLSTRDVASLFRMHQDKQRHQPSGIQSVDWSRIILRVFHLESKLVSLVPVGQGWSPDVSWISQHCSTQAALSFGTIWRLHSHLSAWYLQIEKLIHQFSHQSVWYPAGLAVTRTGSH